MIFNFFSQCQARAEEYAEMQVPRPIPIGKENAVCPMTGLFLTGDEVQWSEFTGAALACMQSDPDVLEEKVFLASLSLNKPSRSEKADGKELAYQFVPLNVSGGAHRPSADTRLLMRSIGLPKLREFTESFYKKSFADPHLDRIICRRDDPHGERFSSWIVEKFGDGAPWTEEGMTRPRDLMQAGNCHFKPDDARVWMRLHFWAAREVGLFEPQYASFMCYYTRFIGHFVSVYSNKAPPFTRESARWSADPQNISKYMAAGNMMVDVIDKPLNRALADLPQSERVYTESNHPNPSWPYKKMMQS